MRAWLAALRRRSPRELVASVAASAALLAIGAFVIAWSGIVNVAASDRHWAVTTLALEFVLRNAVATHSMGIDVPALDDPDLVRLGAGHFAGGCAPCHGAPGQAVAPPFTHMLPAPPPLSAAFARWRAAEVFWIVGERAQVHGHAGLAGARTERRGLGGRGLPAPPAGARPRSLSRARRHRANLPAAAEIARLGADERAVTGCASCHGDAATPPASRLVPALAGLSRSYLAFALRDYAAGTRASGIMQPIAARLDHDQIALLSAYYADLPRARLAAPRAPAPPEQIERGRSLAVAGAAGEGLPPCLACHGRGALEVFPRLDGSLRRTSPASCGCGRRDCATAR